MANSNGNFNPVYNNPSPSKFAHWSSGLDWEDDEFRAGYPFSDIPEMESNDDCESYDTSSTFCSDALQSNNSGIGISTTEENDQVTEFSIQQQENQEDDQLESYPMDERHKYHDLHPSQSTNYDEEELDDDQHHNIKDQVNAVDVETLEPPHHVQTNN